MCSSKIIFSAFAVLLCFNTLTGQEIQFGEYTRLETLKPGYKLKMDGLKKKDIIPKLRVYTKNMGGELSTYKSKDLIIARNAAHYIFSDTAMADISLHFQHSEISSDLYFWFHQDSLYSGPHDSLSHARSMLWLEGFIREVQMEDQRQVVYDAELQLNQYKTDLIRLTRKSKQQKVIQDKYQDTDRRRAKNIRKTDARVAELREKIDIQTKILEEERARLYEMVGE